jgi:hypothetical protein
MKCVRCGLEMRLYKGSKDKWRCKAICETIKRLDIQEPIKLQNFKQNKGNINSPDYRPNNDYQYHGCPEAWLD